MKKPDQLRRHGFTLVEILVVLAIVGLLAALLFPAFNSVRRKSQDVTCLSNLHQIGLATVMYADDYDGFYPFAINPMDLERGHDVLNYYSDENFIKIPTYNQALKSYAKSPTVFHCPRDNGGDFGDIQIDSAFDRWGTSYQYSTLATLVHPFFLDQLQFAEPSQIDLFWDVGDWHDDGVFDSYEANVYVQVVYADAHAGRVRKEHLGSWLFNERE